MDNKRIFGSQKLPITIGITFLLWISLLAVILNKTNVDTSCFLPLDGLLDAEVTHQDGSTTRYDDGDFGRIKEGEKVVLTLRVPEEQTVEDAELFLPINHCILNVFVEGKEIYRDQYNPEDIAEHYGNRVYEVLLPEDYGDKKIEIELTSVVSIPYADLQESGVAVANEGWLRILRGNSFVFVIALTMVVLSLFGVFLFSVQSILNIRARIGLPIAWFELLIGSWFFCSMRFCYILMGNLDISTKGEYFTLYPAVIPLAFFIYMVVDRPIFKTLIISIEIIYVVYYFITLGIEISPIQTNYSKMLSTMHPLAAVVLVVLVLALFFGIRDKSNRHIYILRYGIMIAIFCGMVELARYNVSKYLINASWVTSYSLSSVAIVVIAASLIVYLVSYSAEEYTEQIERKQLMELAYKDPLTGLSNRHACYSEIEKMDKKKINVYTMVFFDVNNLKLANDTYGHEMGDRLLKVAAGYIWKCFSEESFCARWGGDEFVACVYGDVEKARKKMGDFEKLMKKEDEAGNFPFPFSVAYGYAGSNEAAPLEPLDAIRQADAFMYENKVRMKAERKLAR